jgi:hypothetical protein
MLYSECRYAECCGAKAMIIFKFDQKYQTQGDFNFDEAFVHLTSLKVLEISDVTVKDEILAAGLSHPPRLTRLVMQETMSDAKQLIKIIQGQCY